MARSEIPLAVAAKVMFLSDRTCCVCRKEAKPVQIHHIDENNNNHSLRNLAVLCLDCHNLTQIRGGFHRKLDSEQVILYRDDWHASVAPKRAASDAAFAIQRPEGDEIKFVTAIADALSEDGKYVSLAIHYDIWKNPELRDKYIDKAISKGVDAETEIFLRSLQQKPDLVDKRKVDAEIDRLREHEHWSHLGRLYDEVGQPRESVESYCRAIIADLQAGNTFAAAFYLKELGQSDLHARLFEIALEEQQDKGDLWWILRCLQELSWEAEAQSLLFANRQQIEESDNLHLKSALYQALGETDNYIEIEKQIDKLEEE